MSAMLYSELTLCGYLPIEAIKSFRQWGSLTPVIRELDRARAKKHFRTFGTRTRIWCWFCHCRKILCLLGLMILQNISHIFISLMAAFKKRFRKGVEDSRIFRTWKVIMFCDANNIQLSTTVEEVTDEDTLLQSIELGIGMSSL